MVKILSFVWRPGIFAYLNYLTPKTRREVIELLVNGMKRQEYRGYDSAGLAFDSLDAKNMIVVRRQGKVKVLEEALAEREYYAPPYLSPTMVPVLQALGLFRLFVFDVQCSVRLMRTRCSTRTWASRTRAGPHTECPAS